MCSPRLGILAFVVVVGAVAAAASHRPDDSNPVVRYPACWNRSNSLLLGKDDDRTFSAKDSRPRR